MGNNNKRPKFFFGIYLVTKRSEHEFQSWQTSGTFKTDNLLLSVKYKHLKNSSVLPRGQQRYFKYFILSIHFWKIEIFVTLYATRIFNTFGAAV